MRLKVLIRGETSSSLHTVGLGELLERGRVRASKIIDLVSVLEHEEGGDTTDAELLGEVRDFVGVELDKGVLVRDLILVGVLLEEGGDGLARAAPGGVGLEEDIGVRLEELVELSLGGDFLDHFEYSFVKARGACICRDYELSEVFCGAVTGLATNW
jgi:hypothetical protein